MPKLWAWSVRGTREGYNFVGGDRNVRGTRGGYFVGGKRNAPFARSGLRYMQIRTFHIFKQRRAGRTTPVTAHDPQRERRRPPTGHTHAR